MLQDKPAREWLPPSESWCPGAVTSRKERVRTVIDSVLYEFSPRKIPMANSLIQGRIVGNDSIQWLIVGLKIDSYYLDCLQAIKRFSDCLEKGTPPDIDLLAKLFAIAIDLDIPFDSTSFKNTEYLIDDLLNGLITARSAFSPNRESDLCVEFDISLRRYFPNMSSVLLEDRLDKWRQAVKSVSALDMENLRKRELLHGIDSRDAVQAFNLAYEQVEFAQRQASEVLAERLRRWQSDEEISVQ